jgi:hypothetical protein
VVAGEKVAVPAQDGIRADQQAEPLQRRAGQRLEQSGQQRPIGRLEPDPLVAELALQHAELVPQHEDLGVLVMITSGEKPQQREHVRHTEVGQAQEHKPASSRRHRYRSGPGVCPPPAKEANLA